jgi:hypothetical protein
MLYGSIYLRRETREIPMGLGNQSGGFLWGWQGWKVVWGEHPGASDVLLLDLDTGHMVCPVFGHTQILTSA